MSKKSKKKAKIRDLAHGLKKHRDPRDDAVAAKWIVADRLREIRPSNPA